jgi:hypothetical protein
VFASAVSRALKAGARFALDTGMAAESILPNLQERQWTQVDDILFLEENRYRALDSCMETVYTFVRGGETEVRTGFHWVHTVREIRQFLSDAGLAPADIFGSLEGEEFRAGSPYLLLVARKA